MKVKAILFDTRSIQKYIFSGNKLKTNIGASYLVDRLFLDILVEKVLAGQFKYDVDKENWLKNETILMEKNEQLQCEVAYIGGGNALILFNRSIPDETIKKVVQSFTARLLIEAPGLRTGAAIGEIELGNSDAMFKSSLDKLYGKLKINQNISSPAVNVTYTGLTVPCSYNGEVAQIFDEKNLAGDIVRFVSAEIIAKLKQSTVANKALADKFAAELQVDGRSYKFPMELENLGQIETQNYIAIVHIDGNNMGAKFSKCKNLQARKKMSQDIAEKCCNSFKELLRSITDEYEDYQKNTEFAFNDSDEQHYLPIRPLILGGDDVTFICMGRMAVEYAKRYIESMEAKGIDCCGGIAILPTAYPFFRGYELAEQLCGAAKQKSRSKKSENELSSWLDFAILHGEQAPELDQIREREYSGELGNLHFGPYKINAPAYRFAIENLLSGVEQMRKLPSNKVKELRSVLAKGEHEIASFLEQLGKQNLQIPHIEALTNYEESLWYRIDKHENKTPYLDMIEMMDFTFNQDKSKGAKQ